MSLSNRKRTSDQTPDGLSYDTKTLIVVLTLIFVYPAGLVLMYMWMKWSSFVKNIISIPVYLVLLALVMNVIRTINSKELIQKDRAQCTVSCEVSKDKNTCIQTCLNNLNQISPTATP